MNRASQKCIKFYGRCLKKSGLVTKVIELINVERQKTSSLKIDIIEKILAIVGPNSAYSESGATEVGYATF